MSLETDIKQWTSQRKIALISSYNSIGLKASGKWERELTDTVEVTPNRIRVLIDGSRYTEQLLRGRKAGKWPPRGIIRQWIDDKGIVPKGISKDSLAFLIARKIGEQGIEVPTALNSGRLVENAFPESEMTKLEQLIAAHYKTFIKQELIQR